MGFISVIVPMLLASWGPRWLWIRRKNVDEQRRQTLFRGLAAFSVGSSSCSRGVDRALCRTHHPPGQR